MRALNPVIIGATSMGILALAILYVYSIKMTTSFAQWVPQRVATYIATKIALDDDLTYQQPKTIVTSNNRFCLGDEPKRPVPGLLDKSKIEAIEDNSLVNIPSFSYIVYFQEYDGTWKNIKIVKNGNFDEKTLKEAFKKLPTKRGVYEIEDLKNADEFAKNLKKMLDLIIGQIETDTTSNSEKPILPKMLNKLTWFYPEYYVQNIDLSGIFENANNEEHFAEKLLELCNSFKNQYKEVNNKLDLVYDVGLGYNFACASRSIGFYAYPVVIRDNGHNYFGRVIVVVLPLGDKEGYGNYIKDWTEKLSEAYVFSKFNTGG